MMGSSYKSINNIELNVPVAYVIFNRPDCVEKSFESIRNAQPRELYIIADGPRENHPDDAKLCAECRRIVENIDWDCNVYREYSNYNMGCGLRPATGFSWVFSQTDKAIFVEDDCVPSIDFYYFCQEMLEKYETDERIYSISGMNFGFKSDNGADYYFTHYNNSCGWATWKRVWDKYDFAIKDFSKSDIHEILLSFMIEPEYVKFWEQHFEIAYEKKDMSAWDYQFSFLSFINRGLHIYPQKNMVKYIGFDESATHSSNISRTHRLFFSTQQTYNYDFPIQDPARVQADFLVDYLIMKDIFNVYPGGLKHCSRVSDDFVNKIRSYKDVVIYGAGNVAREVIEIFAKEHIDKFLVAVTKLENTKYIVGNCVHELSDLKVKKEETIVVLATISELNSKQMREELNRLEFNNYISVMDYI